VSHRGSNRALRSCREFGGEDRRRRGTELEDEPLQGTSGSEGASRRSARALQRGSGVQGGRSTSGGEKLGRRPLTCSSAPGRFGRERGRDRDGLAPGMVLDSGEASATACGDRGAVVWRNSGGAAARHGGTVRAGTARVLGRRRRWDEEAQGLQGQLKESRASWASVPG